MSEIQKVSDPMQKPKLALGLIVLIVLLFMLGALKDLKKQPNALGGVDIPTDSSVCNSVATNTVATVVQAAPARSQTEFMSISNLSVGDTRISATTTNIHAGILIKASATREFSNEQGNLLKGILYSSSSNAGTAVLQITRCP